MMTVSHIRAPLRRSVPVLLFCVISLCVGAQGKVDFTVNLGGGCTTRAVTCVNTSTGFSNTAVYSWDFGNGNTTTTYSPETPVSAAYSQPQTYTLTLTVKDGKTVVSKSQSLAIYPNPTADFTLSSFKGCLPLTDTLISTFQARGDVLDYYWDFGDGTVLQTNEPVAIHTFSSVASSYVQLIVVNPQLCSSMERKNNAVQILPTCAPSGQFNSGGQAPVTGLHASFTYTSQYIIGNMCPPAAYFFMGNAPGAIRLSWNFGDGSILQNVQNPSHVYNYQGRYAVTLTAMRMDSTLSVYTDSVIVLGPPAFGINLETAQSCKPFTVHLSATGVSYPHYFAYTWYFGDGTTLNTQDTMVNHQYSLPGVYTPALILEDSLKCPALKFSTVPVVIDSIRTSIQPDSYHVCDSAIVRFTPAVFDLSATQLGESLSYHWNFGTGNPGDTSTLASPSFNFRIAGRYAARLTVRSIPGCVYTSTDTILVTDGARGQILGPAEACAGTYLSFSAVGSQGTILQGNGSPPHGENLDWNWILPGGHTDTAQKTSLMMPDPGVYSIILVAGLNGCFDTTIAPLTVNPLPDITLSPRHPRICLGDSVQLTAHGGQSYKWAPSLGLSDVEATTTMARPLVSTTYTVTVSNQYGCTASDSAAVFVATPFSITLPRDTFVCKGESIVLSPFGAYTYRWISGAPETDTASPFLTITPGSDTTYVVVGYDQDHCFTDTAMSTVAVEPIPWVQTVPAAPLPAGNSLQLQALGSPDIQTWDWSPGDYLDCTTCASPLSEPQAPVTYVVTGKTIYGCAASDTLRIQLICMEDRVSIPDAFTPNNDGLNDVFYPRGRGIRVIRHFRIFGRWGNTVFDRQNIPLDDASSGWDGKVNGQNQPVGTYIYELELVCDTGDVFTRKGTVLLER
jgi:gliding motility-associated-like protein